MNRRGAWELGAAFLAAALAVSAQSSGTAAPPHEAAGTVTVDFTQRRQTVYGFGAGLKREAGLLFAMPEPAREEVFKLIFQDVDARILRTFLMDTIEAPDGSFNFNTEPSQGPVSDLWSLFQIQSIQAAEEWSGGRVDTLYASCNSPPGWMKTTGTAYGGTVPPEHVQDFADFIWGYCKGMHDNFGIETGAVSLFNEPGLDVPYTWMDPTPQDAADLVAATGQTMRANYSAQLPGVQRPFILAPDGATVKHTNGFLGTIAASPEAIAVLDVAATHAYGTNTAADWAAFAALAPETPHWQTEVNTNGGGSDGMDDALLTVQRIHDAMSYGNAQAFVQFQWIFQGAEPEGGHGLIRLTGGGGFVVPKRYYAFKQVANTTPRWSVRVVASGAPAGLSVSAFLWPGFEMAAVQVINGSASSFPGQRFALTKILEGGMVREFVTDATRDFTRQADITPAGNSFTASINAYSIHTFLVPVLPCTPPVQAVNLYEATKNASGNAVTLHFHDPNPICKRTGWNVRRSDVPSSQKDSWPLLGTNVADMEPGTPGLQWTDTSGDEPLSGNTWYYQVTAYDTDCPAEGPF